MPQNTTQTRQDTKMAAIEEQVPSTADFELKDLWGSGYLLFVWFAAITLHGLPRAFPIWTFYYKITLAVLTLLVILRPPIISVQKQIDRKNSEAVRVLGVVGILFGLKWYGEALLFVEQPQFGEFAIKMSWLVVTLSTLGSVGAVGVVFWNLMSREEQHEEHREEHREVQGGETKKYINSKLPSHRRAQQ